MIEVVRVGNPAFNKRKSLDHVAIFKEETKLNKKKAYKHIIYMASIVAILLFALTVTKAEKEKSGIIQTNSNIQEGKKHTMFRLAPRGVFADCQMKSDMP